MLARHDLVLRVLVVVLALAGLADALYFTFAYYGRVRKARWVPKILCAREDSSCVTVVQTPYARVFGVPNSLLGIFYYFLVIGCAWDGQRQRMVRGAEMIEVPSPIWIVLVVLSAATVFLGFYLIYALRRKLHTDCPLCYAAHALNTALLVLLILMAR